LLTQPGEQKKDRGGHKKEIIMLNCKYDCIKQLKISDKTLAKALDKNVMYNKHYYKSLESKLKAL
jgi:hypothetical protein